jgi:hypothetical protein
LKKERRSQDRDRLLDTVSVIALVSGMSIPTGGKEPPGLKESGKKL